MDPKVSSDRLGYEDSRYGTGLGAVRLVERLSTKANGHEHAALPETAHQQLDDLQKIYDAAPIGLAVLSRDLRYLRVNRTMAEMSGLAPSDFVGRTIHEIFPGCSGGLMKSFQRPSETRDVLSFEVEGEATPDGGIVRSWGVTWLPLRNDDGEVTGINMVVEDITQRKREADDVHRVADLLEQRVIDRTRDLEREMKERQDTRLILHQLQKIEAIGHLSGGIAHDFNNMLTVISGNIGMLERRLKPGDADLRRFAENALKGVERAGALTQQLLAFARRQPLKAEPVDVNQLVLGMKELLGRTLGETVTVEATLVDAPWPALADTNQLENALLNLAVNSRDAMPNGGRLTMETANATLDEHYAATNAEVTAGEYVTITVIDTGVGMTPDVVALAFEPFFTTKDIGQGTGLGLSQVYGFIKQSGGHVTILSKPGVGTAVTLYLPRLMMAANSDAPVIDDVAPAPAGVAAPVPAGTMRETILVVEDDESVRSSTVGILRDLGYRVLAASDGHSALRTLDREPNIDLLFTDIGLPGGLPGNLLAVAARGKKPDLKVLLTSGYAWDLAVKPGGSSVDLLAKPSTYARMASKVRQVLDGVSASGSASLDRALSLAKRSRDQFAVAAVLECAGSAEKMSGDAAELMDRARSQTS